MNFHAALHNALIALGITLLISKLGSWVFGLRETLLADKGLLVAYEAGILLLVVLCMWLYRRRGQSSCPPAAEPFERTCTEMSFPLLLMYEDDAPELVTSPAELASASDLTGCTIYSKSGVFTITAFRGKPAPASRLQSEGALDIPALKQSIGRSLAADDDLMTQFYDSDVLAHLLSSCTTFEEILCWGTITGGIPADPVPGLPKLVDEDADDDQPELERITALSYTGKLRKEYIRECAAGVSFRTWPDILPVD